MNRSAMHRVHDDYDRSEKRLLHPHYSEGRSSSLRRQSDPLSFSEPTLRFAGSEERNPSAMSDALTGLSRPTNRICLGKGLGERTTKLYTSAWMRRSSEMRVRWSCSRRAYPHFTWKCRNWRREASLRSRCAAGLSRNCRRLMLAQAPRKSSSFGLELQIRRGVQSKHRRKRSRGDRWW